MPQLDCAHTPASLTSLQKNYQSLLDANAGLESTTTWLDTEDEILSKAPLLSRDQIRGWKAIWTSDGGWLAAAKAINAIGEFLRASGVNFGFGSKGSFKQPLLAEGVCVGVETVDGTRYYADKVVLAAGAWSPVLVDLEEQCVSKVGDIFIIFRVYMSVFLCAKAHPRTNRETPLLGRRRTKELISTT